MLEHSNPLTASVVDEVVKALESGLLVSVIDNLVGGLKGGAGRGGGPRRGGS